MRTQLHRNHALAEPALARRIAAAVTASDKADRYGFGCTAPAVVQRGAAVPIVHTVTPDVGYVAGGEIVTLYGENFSPASRCMFGVVLAHSRSLLIARTPIPTYSTDSSPDSHLQY